MTIRPPATEAHYHNPESEKLLMAVFDEAGKPSGDQDDLASPHTKARGEIRQARPQTV